MIAKPQKIRQEKYTKHYPQNVFLNLHKEAPVLIEEGVVINGLVDCCFPVTIEKDVFTGHDVMILTGSHDTSKFGQERQRSTKGGRIIIHEGAWICSGAKILGPCEIGKHAVIAAGAVVRTDVPAYTVAAGVPARTVKHLRPWSQK